MVKLTTHKLLLLVAFLCFSSAILGQKSDTDIIYDAWCNNDVARLAEIHAQCSDAECRIRVQDALATIPDEIYTALTYESLLSIIGKCGHDSIMLRMFNPLLAYQEEYILLQMCSITPKGLLKYVEDYPRRKKLVYDVLGASIVANQSELSVQELLYIHYRLPDLCPQPIEDEIATRDEEIQRIVRMNHCVYLSEESKQADLLYYVLERKAYAYLFMKYEEVCYMYAQVADVPNSVNEMERQYNSIISQCLNSQDLQSYLQLEADGFCEVINIARKNYCRTAGIKQYVPLKIVVPPISFKYYSDREILSKIPEAREQYANDRETVNTVSNVAGFLFGGLAKYASKGLFDYMAGSSLSDNIIAARLMYVDNVFTSMQSCVTQEINQMITTISEQVRKNEDFFNTTIDY